MKSESLQSFSLISYQPTQLVFSVAMEAPPTQNPAPAARPAETAPPAKPPQKAERLIDTKSIGLEVVYSPPIALGSKAARVDVEYVQARL